MAASSEFGTFGRYTETPLGEMPPEMRQAYDFTIALRGQVPGPHRIWLCNPALSKVVVPVGAYYQARSTLTKAEIEIATNLMNGRWLTAYSNHEHETIAEEQGGLAAERVEAMIAGLPTRFDDPRQQVVYELVSALVAPRLVPQGLYRRAKALLGDAGIVDVTMLLGWFTGVSLTLAAFDVPSGATGLLNGFDKPRARLTDIALFPEKSFLENLAVRSDNSVLVTSMNAKALFYVPPSAGTATVEPVLLHTFEQPATGLVEIEPDLFLVSTSNLYTTHESFLHRLDLRAWRPGSPVAPEMVFSFPEKARSLNGSCLLAPGVILIADSFERRSSPCSTTSRMRTANIPRWASRSERTARFTERQGLVAVAGERFSASRRRWSCAYRKPLGRPSEGRGDEPDAAGAFAAALDIGSPLKL